MTFSTSQFINQIAPDFHQPLFESYERRISQIVQHHDYAKDSIINIASNRAAFIVPQLFVELGYEALSGYAMLFDHRFKSTNFSLICLSMGIGDDLIDEPPNIFKERMNFACVSTILFADAFAVISKDEDVIVKAILLEAIDSLVKDITKCGFKEIEYRNIQEFALKEYLEITSLKTTCYTENGLLLGAKLSNILDDNFVILLRNIAKHAGTSIQLIDDLLDLKSDINKEVDTVTYPIFLKSTGENLDKMYSLIFDEIDKSKNLTLKLPYPDKLINVFDKMIDLLDIFSESEKIK